MPVRPIDETEADAQSSETIGSRSSCESCSRAIVYDAPKTAVHREAPEQLERRLAELRSEIGDLIESIRSESVAPAASSASLRGDPGTVELESQLQCRLAELSDQVQAITSEFRAFDGPLSSALPPPNASAPQSRLAIEPSALVTASDTRLTKADPLSEPIKKRERVWPGDITEGGARSHWAGRLSWAAVVLAAVCVATAIAVVTRPRGQTGTAAARAAQVSRPARPVDQAAMQQGAARGVDAARQLQEAREALQRTVDSIDQALATKPGGSVSRTVGPLAPPAPSRSDTAGSSAALVALGSTLKTDGASTSPGPIRPAESQNGAGASTPNSAPLSAAVLVPSLPSVSPPNGQLSNAGDASGSSEGPGIASLVPVSPFVSTSSQTIIVFGVGFQPGLTVATLVPSSSGSAVPTGIQIQRVTATSFEIVLPLASRGTWGIRVGNPDGRQSNVFQFTVR